MTKLGRFLKSAKGIALSGAVTAALYPVAHAALADHVQNSLRVEVDWRTKVYSALASGQQFDERTGWVASERSKEIERLKVQERVLDSALSRLEARNALLESGLASYGRMYSSIERMASEMDAAVPAREQLQLLSEALRSGLSAMKKAAANRLPSLREDGEAIFRVASAESYGAKGLRDGNAAMARAINLTLEDNRLMEDVLGELSGKFDEALRAADSGEAGAEAAAGALRSVASILRQYEMPEEAEAFSPRP